MNLCFLQTSILINLWQFSLLLTSNAITTRHHDRRCSFPYQYHHHYHHYCVYHTSAYFCPKLTILSFHPSDLNITIIYLLSLISSSLSSPSAFPALLSLKLPLFCYQIVSNASLICYKSIIYIGHCHLQSVTRHHFPSAVKTATLS